MMRRPALVLVGALLSLAAHAEAPSDPLAWLGRVAGAAQRLNYVGTFSYQAGKNIETSRIVHMVDGSGEYERLEVLDGSPREVIRANGELRCVLPEQRTVIIDQPGNRRAFPARLPASFGSLAESYRIRKGDVGRVAGLEAQQIVLEPKDDLRYGHLLWADQSSGLLLKARMVDGRGEMVEQFVFNEVRIGGEIERERLQSRFGSAGDWRVVNARGSELRSEDAGWFVRTPLPGFYQTATMRRKLGPDRGEAVHMVFSDGMVSISAFVEPVSGDASKIEGGEFSSGAVNIYKRPVSGHMITVLGEVPARAVKRLGDAIEKKVE